MLPRIISSSPLLSFTILLRLTTHHCSSMKLDEDHPPPLRHYQKASLLVPAIFRHNEEKERKMSRKLRGHLDSQNIYNAKTFHPIDGSEPSEEDKSSLNTHIKTSSSFHQSTQKARLLPQVSSEMQTMINLINEERRNLSLAELCFNAKLNEAAIAHSNDMRDNDFFSHQGSDGSQFWERINRTGYDWIVGAENIAINWSILGAHESLMGSWEHRENILKEDAKQIGIGITKYTSGSYSGDYVITQVFAASFGTEECIDDTNLRPIDISPSPSEYPSEYPSAYPSDYPSMCLDTPNWYDSDGPYYDCAWYALKVRHCQQYGDGYHNFGKSANDACCACGGGSF